MIKVYDKININGGCKKLKIYNFNYSICIILLVFDILLKIYKIKSIIIKLGSKVKYPKIVSIPDYLEGIYQNKYSFWSI